MIIPIVMKFSEIMRNKYKMAAVKMKLLSRPPEFRTTECKHSFDRTLICGVCVCVCVCVCVREKDEVQMHMRSEESGAP